MRSRRSTKRRRTSRGSLVCQSSSAGSDGAACDLVPVPRSRPSGVHARLCEAGVQRLYGLEQRRVERLHLRARCGEEFLAVLVLPFVLRLLHLARKERFAEHKRLESYENVHHLVSRVTGRLDAGTDTVQNPVHTYTTAGTYTVTLVVHFLLVGYVLAGSGWLVVEAEQDPAVLAALKAQLWAALERP